MTWFSSNPKGAFHCVAVVPGPDDRARPWALRPPTTSEPATNAALLLGDDATMEMSDADPPEQTGPRRPWVLRSRFTLRGRHGAAVFHLDRSIGTALREGDRIHVARTERGGLGVSVLRDQRLLVAAGTITAVPLGEGVQARIAPERQREALADVSPPPGGRKPDYSGEYPLEIRASRRELLCFRCFSDALEDLELFVIDAFRIGGGDECAALYRRGQCSPSGANASAFLLGTDGLSSWRPATEMSSSE